MRSRIAETEQELVLAPYPEGWYFVASRRDLGRAKLIEKTWMGLEVVVWIDEQGNTCVAEAYCPHLGAYLGPDGGGEVCGGRLVCPFHGFEFDASGQCVATPYAPPPRSARLRVFPTHEMLGMIFAWWSPANRQPQWQLPDEAPAQDGWSGIRISKLRFPGHPQETAENSVDLAHLRYVHGYGSVAQPEQVTVEEHKLISRFLFKSERKLGRWTYLTIDVDATATLLGLGYSFVEVREQDIGMDTRLWILPTPIDGELIDLSIVTQVKELRDPKRRVMGLKFLPLGWRAPLLNRFLNVLQRRDVLQDVTIWSRKRYRPLPRLCRSDGEIATYRKYCSQFYPVAEAWQAVETANTAEARHSDNLHLVAD